jgi:phage repressor protein C with HTH and peptisase S24 domain
MERTELKAARCCAEQNVLWLLLVAVFHSRWFSYGDLDGQINETIPGATKDPNSFALILEGDSMEPRFPAGCRIIAEPNSEARNGNLVVARLAATGGVIFKKFRRTGKDGCVIRLESINPDYSPLEYPVQAFRWIYPVVEIHERLHR